MLKKVLIANRGEAALRVVNTCRAHDIATVVVYAKGDENKRLIHAATESICIGPSAASDSYLNIHALLSAAEVMEVDAIHPVYGFLSESHHFASQIENQGIVFVGPTPDQMRTMGNKTSSIQFMKKYGVSCVPSTDVLNNYTDQEIIAMVQEIGYPVLLKSVSGGGGKGIRLVHVPHELLDLLNLSKLEAMKTNGCDRIYVEKFLSHPRHIELQILGDGRGEVVCLGTRDCSMQRHYQKIIEEAPAIMMDEGVLQSVINQSLKAMCHLKYRGAGTLEFLYQDNVFYFIEMNTRLQVEHTVTEMITGVDIVYEQLRVASGFSISPHARNARTEGHAIQCRINAEHPKTFLPTPGLISMCHFPSGYGLRVESAVYTGYTVPPFYDSMIVKLISFGSDRACAIRRMQYALQESIIEGIETNFSMQERLLKHEKFVQGSYSNQSFRHCLV